MMPENKLPPWKRPKLVAVTANSDAPRPEPGSMLDHALRYAALGWYVFPVWGGKDGKCNCGSACSSPGKHPISALAPRGQDDATTDPARIHAWWGQMPGAGIGVFLRPSGLMAIDIDPRNGGFETMDVIEAEHGALTSDVYQFTQNGGEHRIFKLSDSVGIPGKLGPGVDLKHNGYIVVAPTQGVVGRYDWEASSDPLQGSIPSPLPDWLRGLQRPADPAGAVDMFVSRFAAPEQIAELRDALTHLDADDRDTWVRFGLALRPLGQAGWSVWTEWSQTSTKFDPVDQIRCWRSFRPSEIGFESIFFAAQQVGWVNPKAGSLPPATPAADAQLPPPADPAPPAPSFHLPGVLGQVQDWIDATARKPQPMFAVQAAIAFGAAVLGRRYVTTQRNWPSLYLLNIGKSASGKEHAKWAIEHLLEACGLERLVGPDSYTSDSGVLSSLHRQPAHVAVVDEFGKVLEAASIKHSARGASTMRALMEVWGRADGTLRPQGYSTFGMTDMEVDKITAKAVRNPALTLLAMTTPDTFFDTLGSAAARDGFLNRFLVVESDIGRQPGRPVASLPVPQTIIDWAKDAHAGTGLVDADINPTLAPTAKVIPIAPEAQSAFGRYEAECIGLMDRYEDRGLSEIFGRTAEISMRLALILALSRGNQRVTVDDAEWAIAYTRHHAVRLADRLQDSVADSEFEALKLQVLACVRQAGPRGVTERELNKVSRKFRAVDQRQQLNVLNSLAFAADIQRIEFPPASGRGSARRAWVLAPTDADTTVPG